MLKAGMVIGAYRIVQELGAGGMGQVWLAEHQRLGRRAAIKVLHSQYSAQPEIVNRFFNEARAATAINDPGIVQIFDFGNHTDGSAYIVMEMLEGESLDRRLRTQGALTIPHALRLIRQIATSLAAAHARGIIHRDLKPENIYVVRDPEVAGGERTKLLDFGIAKLSGDARGSWRTSTSAVMGTPYYMSPEQCRGAGEVDLRSDIYSLGCVMFRLLTNRLPFEAVGSGELIAMHLREAPPPPSRYNKSIPPAVDQLVLRCLAKDPAHRFSSGIALGAEIEALLSSPLAMALSGSATAIPQQMAQGMSTPPPAAIYTPAPTPVHAGAYAAAPTPAPMSTPMATPMSSSGHPTPAPMSTPSPMSPTPMTPLAHGAPTMATGVDHHGVHHHAKPTTLSGAASERTLEPPRRSRRPWVVVGGLAAGVLAIVIVVATSSSSSSTSPEPAAAPASTPEPTTAPTPATTTQPSTETPPQPSTAGTTQPSTETPSVPPQPVTPPVTSETSTQPSTPTSSTSSTSSTSTTAPKPTRTTTPTTPKKTPTTTSKPTTTKTPPAGSSATTTTTPTPTPTPTPTRKHEVDLNGDGIPDVR